MTWAIPWAAGCSHVTNQCCLPSISRNRRSWALSLNCGIADALAGTPWGTAALGAGPPAPLTHRRRSRHSERELDQILVGAGDQHLASRAQRIVVQADDVSIACRQ